MCTVLTRETGGSYHVILDESHFKELLMLHVKPPPATSSSECSLIRMGEFLDASTPTVGGGGVGGAVPEEEPGGFSQRLQELLNQ